MIRFVFATLLVALGTPPPATAVDLSGDYVGFALVPFAVTLVQTGTALQMTGHIVVNADTDELSATGTVDPATGAFSVAGEITGACADFVYSGTGDGEELTGTFTSRTCPSGPVLLSKCGNGVIDPLENCDDGNQADGGCCSARCRLEPAGTACTSDGNACTDDVCSATGACLHVPNSTHAGQACDDDFDPCTADVCDAAGSCTHVPVSPAECRRALACHSTCTQQLKACKQTCPGGGQGRRDCRAACAERSSCTAPGARIRTLAYVMTDCTADPQGQSALSQKLVIRRGNCDPVTVREFAATGGAEVFRQCQASGESRSRDAFTFFQRLAVLPDGSGVVFEVTSPQGGILSAPPEEGIFLAQARGRGRLRPLGPPSRSPLGVAGVADEFPVSPDGRTIALIDLGPFDAAGHEAPQIFSLDTRSGYRRQLTHQTNPVCCESFVDNRTVIFHVYPHGVNTGRIFEVRTDGRSPEKELPSIVLPGGGRVVTQFEVSDAKPRPLYVYFPDRRAVKENPDYEGRGQTGSSEVFLLDRKNRVQLTNFQRADTDQTGAFIDRGRVLFGASVNLGENPHEICQLFSIDTLGADLRQVTHLPWDGRPSTGGCGPSPACTINQLFVDPRTATVLFQSSCDPLRANPFGAQFFAMRPDGTGLRQLTNARGMTTDPDGTIHVELPGPAAYTSAAGG